MLLLQALATGALSAQRLAAAGFGVGATLYALTHLGSAAPPR